VEAKFIAPREDSLPGRGLLRLVEGGPNRERRGWGTIVDG